MAKSWHVTILTVWCSVQKGDCRCLQCRHRGSSLLQLRRQSRLPQLCESVKTGCIPEVLDNNLDAFHFNVQVGGSEFCQGLSKRWIYIVFDQLYGVAASYFWWVVWNSHIFQSKDVLRALQNNPVHLIRHDGDNNRSVNMKWRRRRYQRPIVGATTQNFIETMEQGVAEIVKLSDSLAWF